MTVVSTRGEPLGEGNRPAWSRATSAGIFRVGREGGRFDRHYHDCDELWLFADARGEVWLDGEVYSMTPGTAVYTPMGTVHRFQLFEETWGDDCAGAFCRTAAGRALRGGAGQHDVAA